MFITSDPDTGPAALLHRLEHNKILHEQHVVLTICAAQVPRAAEEERARIEPVGDSFWRATSTYG